MRRIALGLVVILCVMVPVTPAGRSDAIAAGVPGLTDVRAAFALCRQHPTTHVLWLRGWFIPGINLDGSVDGGLFESPTAVPLTTVNQWDVQQHWRLYGSIFVHIHTRSQFGARSLTLHGTLDCGSAQFWTDRDPFPPPHLATTYTGEQVGRDGSVTTSATSGGLQLTITIPRRTYPRNALALVSVAMKNVADHAIGYWVTPLGPPGMAVPQVEVLDSAGNVLFPPAMPYWPLLPGPAPFLATLAPGQTVAQHEYIVVRGARIRVSQQFALRAQPNAALDRPLSTVATRPITVRLTSESAPAISLYSSGGDLRADITRPAGVIGRPLELSYVDCGFPSYDYTAGWVPSGTSLTAGCAPVREWHLRVAWLNHPVAALDYAPNIPTPGPTPTPSPTATPTTMPSVPAQFADLLGKASRAMAAVHTLHATGLHQVIDSSHQPALTIHSQCRSSASTGLPITLQTLRSSGYQGALTNDGYLISGPVIPQPGTVTRVWWRSPSTSLRWQAIDVFRRWGLDSGIGDPVFGPNPAYINQACPDLIRLTYLTAPLANLTSPRVLGMTTLNGHRVWHLREQDYFKLDLFIDASSYRLLRLRLWDGVKPNSRWQVRFDYSGFNAPLRIPLPPRAK